MAKVKTPSGIKRYPYTKKGKAQARRAKAQARRATKKHA